MAFLILSRAAVEDVKTRPLVRGEKLYFNAELLTQEEVVYFQNAAVELHILPDLIDPQDATALQAAIRRIQEQSGAPVWVGHAPFGQTADLSEPDEKPTAEPAIQKKRLHDRLAGNAGRAFRYLKHRVFTERPLLVIPYFGYGNATRLTFRGRVLLDEEFGMPTPDAGGWSNFIEFYKRLESDEISGARVRVQFQGKEHEAVTDRGGYFTFDMALKEPITQAGWHQLAVELVDPPSARNTAVHAMASVLLPSSTARFGVISDIDDTIVWTNVTNKFNMLRMLARSNAHTRKPFKGVAAFYRALHEGVAGNEQNPIFYVSSSPWHLFSPLVHFLQAQDIPLGPLMLKELGLRKIFGSDRHRSHKLEQIEKILNFYPDLPFILIGDSGEQDPEIYAEVVKRHPKAVRVIYIRNVNPDPARVDAIDRLIEEVRPTGAQLILAPDSELAAAHAAAEGLIKPLSMAAVREDKAADEDLNLPSQLS